MNPTFGGIVEKAREIGGIPTYRPIDKNEQVKLHNWIYKSGMDDGVKAVLNLFGYE